MGVQNRRPSWPRGASRSSSGHRRRRRHDRRRHRAGRPGVETKHFHVRDGLAFSLWHQAGKQAAILSGRSGGRRPPCGRAEDRPCAPGARTEGGSASSLDRKARPVAAPGLLSWATTCPICPCSWPSAWPPARPTPRRGQGRRPSRSRRRRRRGRSPRSRRGHPEVSGELDRPDFRAAVPQPPRQN